jgi:hypothetical protein
MIILLTAVVAYLISKSPKLYLSILLIYSILFIFSVGKITFQHIHILNTQNSKTETLGNRYVRGEISINDYLKIQYPKTYSIIKWCENNDEMIDLFYADPKLSGLDDENSLHAFFLGCKYQRVELSKDKQIDIIANDFLSQKKGSYFLALDGCMVGEKNTYNDKFYFDRYELNQKIVCRSEEISPHLYRISN